MGRASGHAGGGRPRVHGLHREASHRPVRQPTAASGTSAHKLSTRRGRRGRFPFALSWPLDRTEPKSVRYAPGLKCQGSPRPYTRFDTPQRRRYYRIAPVGHISCGLGSTARRRTPMKLAYFDCFSGISGDMTLGALLDAGCDLEHLRKELRGLHVPGWELSAEKVWKNGIAATYARVKTEDQQKHRALSTTLGILQNSQLAAPGRERAAAIYDEP